MRMLFAFLLAGVLWGKTDTLVTINVEPQPAHKDTVYYSLWSGINSLTLADVRDSVAIYRAKVVILDIFSYGGEPFSVFEFYGWCKQRGVKIVTITHSLALSSGILLFLTGEERYVSKYAILMLHPISSWVWIQQITPEWAKKQHYAFDILQTDINRFISDRTGLPLKTVEKLVAEESWLTAEDALKYKIATEILWRDVDGDNVNY